LSFDRKVGQIKMESKFVIFLLFVFMADLTSVVNSQSKTTVSLLCYDIDEALGSTYGTFTGNLG
jgi:hypothetical protein